MHRIACVLAAVAVSVAVAAAADGAGRRSRADSAVPVLMYHVTAAPPAGATYPELYVSPADFRAQMNWLARNGYHAVTLSAVYDAWFGQRPLPSRPVVVSFDDGYHSQAAVAAKALRAHRWPGVLNLEVRNMRVPWGLPPRRVRALIAAGWELAAHTITHPDLRTLDDAQLREEVAGSREELRRMFGVPVDFFCYPAGRYDDRVVAAVRAAGYLGATTTGYGLARPDEMYTLKRIRVNGSDGVAGFAAKMTALG